MSKISFFPNIYTITCVYCYRFSFLYGTRILQSLRESMTFCFDSLSIDHNLTSLVKRYKLQDDGYFIFSYQFLDTNSSCLDKYVNQTSQVKAGFVLLLFLEILPTILFTTPNTQTLLNTVSWEGATISVILEMYSFISQLI